MTDREKAIIMAHTGYCMLTGDKFQIFHRYIEDVMGRPVMTHEIGWLKDEIEKKTKADFLELCDSTEGNSNKWIPVSERLPEDKQSVLVWCPQYKNIYCSYREKEQWWIFGAFVQIVPNEVLAWMPLPEPYEAESEGADASSN